MITCLEGRNRGDTRKSSSLRCRMSLWCCYSWNSLKHCFYNYESCRSQIWKTSYLVVSEKQHGIIVKIVDSGASLPKCKSPNLPLASQVTLGHLLFCASVSHLWNKGIISLRRLLWGLHKLMLLNYFNTVIIFNMYIFIKY